MKNKEDLFIARYDFCENKTQCGLLLHFKCMKSRKWNFLRIGLHLHADLLYHQCMKLLQVWLWRTLGIEGKECPSFLKRWINHTQELDSASLSRLYVTQVISVILIEHRRRHNNHKNEFLKQGDITKTFSN